MLRTDVLQKVADKERKAVDTVFDFLMASLPHGFLKINKLLFSYDTLTPYTQGI